MLECIYGKSVLRLVKSMKKVKCLCRIPSQTHDLNNKTATLPKGMKKSLPEISFLEHKDHMDSSDPNFQVPKCNS